MKLFHFAAVLACACTSIVHAQAPKPNVIFVLVDDMGSELSVRPRFR